jgi:PilZ domain
MQHSAHNASGRREDRVPLAGVVSVREAQRGPVTEPQLEADGLNVSIGGIAMRARFVPSPGSLLECTFSCPPTGELVSAQGEVMWSEPHGLGHGQFGLRFVELDTKSATALRRLVSKDGGDVPKAARSRTARLLIEGLETGVEAELKLVDETRVVLEQSLSFLQLGRGVEVTVPGRGKERGRIASIELRHGQLDVPKLVFGILLDDAHAKAPASLPPGSAPWFTAELEEPFPGLHAVRAAAAGAVHERRVERASEAPPASFQTEERERISELALDRTSELSLDHASARSLDRASARFRDSALPGTPAPPAQPKGPPEQPDERAAGQREHSMAAAREALASAPPTATLQGLGQLVVELERYSELPSDVVDDEFASLVPEGPDEGEPVVALAAARVRESTPERLMLAADAEFDEPTKRTFAQSEPPPAELTRAEPAQPEVAPDDDPAELHEHDPFAETDTALQAPGLTLGNAMLWLRGKFRSQLRSQADNISELRQRIEPALREQAESLDLPEAKHRMLAWFARLNLFVRTLFARSKRQRETEAAEPGKKRKVPLRRQRTTLPGVVVPPEDEAVTETARSTLAFAGLLALAGMGLAAYVLVPRAPADRIELPARIATAQEPPKASASAPPDDALALDIEPAPAAPKSEGKKKKKEPLAAAAPVAEARAPTPAPFGELEVPNGRVFSLRMNGPITSLEGVAFENGFTVKVPGRNPIDPARPIASAHRAVKRALFMNQGKYAELTIEFLPGFAPHYQVRAKGDALEITLERL